MSGECFFPYISTDRCHSDLVSFERPLQPDIMGGFYAWDQFFTSSWGSNVTAATWTSRTGSLVSPAATASAATIEWAHGLYRNGGHVARITRNVLDRLGS